MIGAWVGGCVALQSVTLSVQYTHVATGGMHAWVCEDSLACIQQ